jgi:hypothetical protein
MTETSGPAPTSSTPTPEPRRALSPWTAGGESVNIKLPDLTYFHYAQNDTKLNSAVWAMFPVEKDQKEIARELDVAHRVLAR